MKITSLSFIMLFLAFTASAQDKSTDNPNQFGIMMNANTSSFQYQLSDWTQNGVDQKINALSSDYSYGFDLGILYSYTLNKYISISPQALVSFQERSMNYSLSNDSELNEKYEAVAVNLPMHILFSYPIGNIKPIFHLGTNLEFYINEIQDEKNLRLADNNWSIDIGPGIELDFKKFKLRPSLIYSYGLKDLKLEQDDAFNNAFNSIKTDNISLRIAFYN